jgi:large repetitive protein
MPRSKRGFTVVKKANAQNSEATRAQHQSNAGNWKTALLLSAAGIVCGNSVAHAQIVTGTLPPFQCSSDFYEGIGTMSPVTGLPVAGNPLYYYDTATQTYTPVRSETPNPNIVFMNAIGYNVNDNYMYAIISGGRLGRMGANGEVNDLGQPVAAPGQPLAGIAGLPSTTIVNNGSMDKDNKLYIWDTRSAKTIVEIDVVTNTYKSLFFSGNTGSAFNPADSVWVSNGPGTKGTLIFVNGNIVRFNLDTLVADTIPYIIPNLPLAGYGAAWSPLGGNVFFSNNSTGRIYEIAGATTATPSIVASYPGFRSSAHDGASCSNAPAPALVSTNIVVARDDTAPLQPEGTANPAVINIVDNPSGRDYIGGNPPVLTGTNQNGSVTVTSPATPATPGAPVPTLDPVTGIISMPANVPPGLYEISYQLCEFAAGATTANCDTATINIPVSAGPVVATNDSATGISSMLGNANAINAFTGDTINGAAATSANATLSVAPGSIVPAGLTFDTATGNVAVAPNTPAGTYTFNYQICERATGTTNCKTATISVTVIAGDIVATSDSINSVASGAVNVINAFTGDTINNAPATATTGSLTVASGSTVPPELIFDAATGNVSVAAGAPGGIYSFDYRICERATPSNCKTATITVGVTAGTIGSSNDNPTVGPNQTPSPVNGADGNANAGNAYANDTLGGQPLDPADILGTILTPATPVRAGAPVPTMDPVTGTIAVPAGTPAGTYSIEYRICELSAPANCATSTVQVQVSAPPITATGNTVTGVNGAAGQTNVLNVLTGDTINGQPATTTNAVLSVAASSTVPAQLNFDPATGAVSVNPGTPSGVYTFDYQICDAINGTSNCRVETVSVSVTGGSIASSPDTPTRGTGNVPVNGTTGSANAGNAYANDTLGGNAIDPATIIGTILTPATPLRPGAPVPTMDPATGTIAVPAGTPAGAYTIEYRICERSEPTNCATSTIQVDIAAPTIDAVNNVISGVNGTSGATSVVNVLSGDSLNGVAVTLATVSLDLPAGSVVPSALTFDPATGDVSVKPNTPAGTYSFNYRICEKLNPNNCDTATVSITVNGAPIAANVDTPAPVNGATGGSAGNAYANDLLNGAAVSPSTITGRVTSPATPARVGAPVPVLNPVTGDVTVLAGTPAGTYTIGYEICETLSPANCATSTVTVTISAATIVATNDTVNNINGATGGANVGNVFAGDTINGQPATAANAVLSVAPGSTVPTGLTFDPATGNVSVAAGTPSGAYSFNYRICETLNPSNCRVATFTVNVTDSSIAATGDTVNGINGTNGAPNATNAFNGDTINGQPATTANAILSLAPNAVVPAGLTFDPATGNVAVAPNTPAGTYSFDYQICERASPTNCRTATISVVVGSALIEAIADAPASVRTGVGSTNLVNAFANDRLNGQPVTAALITARVVTAAANPGVVLDPATGIVSVAADVPPGTYTVVYEICERLNPANCAQSSVTVVVTPAVSSVSGTVFVDSDGDGTLDPGEATRAGWKVEVLDANNMVVGTATTNASGFYQIDGITSGQGYKIQFRSPETNVVYDVIENVNLGQGNVVANQNKAIDPSGIVYDSVTRLPLAGATLVLNDARGNALPRACFIDASQQSQTTGASGEYRFDIIPGAAAECPTAEAIYSIVVAPRAGYSAVSSVLLPQTGAFDPTGRPAPARIVNSPLPPAAGGDATYYLSFRLAAGDPDVLFNHIPLDPFLTRASLVVTKTSLKRSVSVGDLVPYQITVRNTEPAQRAGVNVIDIIPSGFKYVTGTAAVDGRASEPTQDGRQLVWRGQVIPANGSVKYNLTMVVGAGVTSGERVNTGLAQDAGNNADISNRGTAVVSIAPSAVFDCSDLIGKVFEDLNANGHQDAGERPLSNARLVTVNGQIVTTDQFGRYHITCALVPDARVGSNFVLKVDPTSLPPGYRLTQDNPQSIRLTRGKMGELNFGAAPANRTQVTISDAEFTPGTMALKAEFARQIASLPATISGDHPAIVLHYVLTADEDASVAKARVDALAGQISTLMATAYPTKKVAFETRFVRSGQAQAQVK